MLDEEKIAGLKKRLEQGNRKFEINARIEIGKRIDPYQIYFVIPDNFSDIKSLYEMITDVFGSYYLVSSANMSINGVAFIRQQDFHNTNNILSDGT